MRLAQPAGEGEETLRVHSRGRELEHRKVRRAVSWGGSGLTSRARPRGPTTPRPQWPWWECRAERVLVSHWLEPQENHSRAPLGLSFLICTDHSNTLPFTIYSFGKCLWNASISQARAGCKEQWQAKTNLFRPSWGALDRLSSPG